jgi:hypothetical protein
MTGYYLDDELIDAFRAGSLDQRGEAALAEQVARVLPFRWALPNRTAAALSSLVGHLGGDQALLAWLRNHAGVPRLVASTYLLVGLLDLLSDRPAVVEALRETRQQAGLPASLEARLVPDTSGDTLASLGGQIETLLGEDRFAEAAETALATVQMLQLVVSRAAREDPGLEDAGVQLERLRDELDTVVDAQ